MLLMVLHRDLHTSIITASVATVLFASFLAITARSLEGKNVLAAVAVYAAVLVVFVGTSLTPIS
jgi:predicted cation transporter